MEIGLDREIALINTRSKPSTSAVNSAEIHNSLPRAPLQGVGRVESSPVVQYLYRTVKDFIESPGVWSWLQAVTETGFEAELIICKAHLLSLKVCFPQNGWGKNAKGCLDYARKVSKHSNDTKVHDNLALLVAELDSTAEAISRTVWEQDLYIWAPQWILNPHISPSIGTYTGRTFLSLAVRLGLYSYVGANVKTGCIMKQSANDFSPEFRNTMSLPSQTLKTRAIWPLLLDACIEDPLLKEKFSIVSLDVKMVDLLLANGANPYYKAPDAQYTVLETIARASDVQTVRLLLSKTQLGNIITPKNKNLILSIAASSKKATQGRYADNDLTKPERNRFWPKFFAK